ncbi:hypothetical protein B484DRAFT_66456 [Ochromonadaceae sp. CCMP2298]|nr:hypothetical protein B484DRAFT_66456 [Ochromonadaceae sp. CCMP2298]
MIQSFSGASNERSPMELYRDVVCGLLKDSSASTRTAAVLSRDKEGMDDLMAQVADSMRSEDATVALHAVGVFSWLASRGSSSDGESSGGASGRRAVRSLLQHLSSSDDRFVLLALFCIATQQTSAFAEAAVELTEAMLPLLGLGVTSGSSTTKVESKLTYWSFHALLNLAHQHPHVHTCYSQHICGQLMGPLLAALGEKSPLLYELRRAADFNIHDFFPEEAKEEEEPRSSYAVPVDSHPTAKRSFLLSLHVELLLAIPGTGGRFTAMLPQVYARCKDVSAIVREVCTRNSGEQHQKVRGVCGLWSLWVKICADLLCRTHTDQITAIKQGNGQEAGLGMRAGEGEGEVEWWGEGASESAARFHDLLAPKNGIGVLAAPLRHVLKRSRSVAADCYAAIARALVEGTCRWHEPCNVLKLLLRCLHNILCTSTSTSTSPKSRVGALDKAGSHCQAVLDEEYQEAEAVRGAGWVLELLVGHIDPDYVGAVMGVSVSRGAKPSPVNPRISLRTLVDQMSQCWRPSEGSEGAEGAERRLFSALMAMRKMRVGAACLASQQHHYQHQYQQQSVSVIVRHRDLSKGLFSCRGAGITKRDLTFLSGHSLAQGQGGPGPRGQGDSRVISAAPPRQAQSPPPPVESLRTLRALGALLRDLVGAFEEAGAAYAEYVHRHSHTHGHPIHPTHPMPSTHPMLSPISPRDRVQGECALPSRFGKCGECEECGECATLKPVEEMMLAYEEARCDLAVAVGEAVSAWQMAIVALARGLFSGMGGMGGMGGPPHTPYSPYAPYGEYPFPFSPFSDPRFQTTQLGVLSAYPGSGSGHANVNGNGSGGNGNGYGISDYVNGVPSSQMQRQGPGPGQGQVHGSAHAYTGGRQKAGLDFDGEVDGGAEMDECRGGGIEEGEEQIIMCSSAPAEAREAALEVCQLSAEMWGVWLALHHMMRTYEHTGGIETGQMGQDLGTVVGRSRGLIVESWWWFLHRTSAFGVDVDEGEGEGEGEGGGGGEKGGQGEVQGEGPAGLGLSAEVGDRNKGVIKGLAGLVRAVQTAQPSLAATRCPATAVSTRPISLPHTTYHIPSYHHTIIPSYHNTIIAYHHTIIPSYLKHIPLSLPL